MGQQPRNCISLFLDVNIINVHNTLYRSQITGFRNFYRSSNMYRHSQLALIMRGVLLILCRQLLLKIKVWISGNRMEMSKTRGESFKARGGTFKDVPSMFLFKYRMVGAWSLLLEAIMIVAFIKHFDRHMVIKGTE